MNVQLVRFPFLPGVSAPTLNGSKKETTRFQPGQGSHQAPGDQQPAAGSLRGRHRGAWRPSELREVIVRRLLRLQGGSVTRPPPNPSQPRNHPWPDRICARTRVPRTALHQASGTDQAPKTALPRTGTALHNQAPGTARHQAPGTAQPHYCQSLLFPCRGLPKLVGNIAPY